MRHENHRHNGRRRLYRDRHRGWVAGVCAGVANHLAMPVFIIRLLTVLALISPLLPLVVIGYIVMTLKTPVEPADLYANPEARSFYQHAQREPLATIGQVRHQIRSLEHRLRKMEAYVTSREFEFDQGLER